jgi:peptidoglycan/xylan/chitin deacetylase (PgdA/CDA1 family)
VYRQQEIQGNFRAYEPQRRRKQSGSKLVPVIAVVVVLIVLVGGFFLYNTFKPIDLVVNDKKVVYPAFTKVEALFEKDLIEPDPGNLLAIDGTTLTFGEGEAGKVLVNGEEITDRSMTLHNNDVVQTVKGADKTEPYSDETYPVSSEFIEVGYGALSVLSSVGNDGEEAVRTGELSGLVQTVVLTQKVDTVVTHYNPAPAEKLIALTLDDGPSGYTEDVLAVLDKYDVKATFFELGENVDSLPSEAKAVADRGHQVASHSYAHKQLNAISTEDAIAEWQNAQDAIERATGVKTTVGRAPYGEYSFALWKTVPHELITVLALWNIDTNDWQGRSPEAIRDTIVQEAHSGAIILCHDGGGERTKTIQALDMAIPELQSRGYTFVTIDELVAASPPPAQE